MGTSELGQLPHKVDLSRKRPFGTALRADLKETFFPDDPFRVFSSQSRGRRAWTALQYYVPILEWGAKYNLSKFQFDLLAGITIASLAIPQGISYAKLADIPPIIGLYSAAVPPIIYAIFGSSKQLAVGPVAAASLLMASIIKTEVTPQSDPVLYPKLFFTAAFVTGAMQLSMGILRLGILVDFLSRSTIAGFMGGTAVIIMLQQLKGLLGLKTFTQHTDIVSVIKAVIINRAECKWQSVLVGIVFLCILLGSRHLRTACPRLFWVSAMAPLFVVISGCLIAFLVHGEANGIPTVGDLKKGVNPITIGQLQFKSEHFGVALKAGLIAGFIALAEGIAVGRSLALAANDQIDGNKEMIAYGCMNIVGSFTSCYLTTGPFSKSAVNAHAGCKTQMSNVVHSVCMLLVLLFLAPLFKWTPSVALSAIIVVAMIGLIEYEEYVHLFKVDKVDFLICMVAFFGVSFLSMDMGLVMSVGLSIIRALIYMARPHTSKLGKLGSVDGTYIFRDMEQYPDAVNIPGVLVLTLGSPVYFANAGYLRERISRWLEAEEDYAKKNGDEVNYVVLDLSGVTSIDSSGLGMLKELNVTLERREIKMVLINPRLRVVEKLTKAHVIDLVGSEWVFLTVKDAVTACHFALEESRHKGRAQ
ncbi:putative sulfate transporter 3.5 [Iris pallida]|uniref:Sulfate transporter 3.5 n=1 Tax=Iris pallida TaxID=29817 RepID=A0AAX6FBZ3_IRIPA|nr:putative sulfate transporter 3.5 [Iris pallida]